MSRWYRAYEGTVTDPKLAEAAMIVGCSRALSIATWHCILESAASVNNGGTFNTAPRRVAAVLCETLDTIEDLFAAFEELELIGSSAVNSWQRRQFESDSSTERSRKHRANKCNGDATLQQQPATPPYTETETETEETGAKAPYARTRDAFPAPEGVPPETWADFRGSPKRRKAGMSRTAYAGIINNLRTLAEHGFPPGEMIALAVERGWTTVKLEWVQDDGRRNQTDRRNGQRMGGPGPDPTLALVRAATAAQREGGGDHGQARAALPSGQFGGP